MYEDDEKISQKKCHKILYQKNIKKITLLKYILDNIKCFLLGHFEPFFYFIFIAFRFMLRGYFGVTQHLLAVVWLIKKKDYLIHQEIKSPVKLSRVWSILPN